MLGTYDSGMGKKREPKPPFWGPRFKDLLDEKKLSVRALADRMGRKHATVTHWANGHRPVKLDDFLSMCYKADLDPVIVLFGAGYIPQELRDRVQGLAKDILEAQPSSKPSYRPAIAKLRSKVRA